MHKPKLLRAKDVMAILGISRWHLNKFLDAGIFTRVHLPDSKFWRISTGEVERYLKINVR